MFHYIHKSKCDSEPYSTCKYVIFSVKFDRCIAFMLHMHYCHNAGKNIPWEFFNLCKSCGLVLMLNGGVKPSPRPGKRRDGEMQGERERAVVGCKAF